MPSVLPRCKLHAILIFTIARVTHDVTHHHSPRDLSTTNLFTFFLPFFLPSGSSLFAHPFAYFPLLFSFFFLPSPLSLSLSFCQPFFPISFSVPRSSGRIRAMEMNKRVVIEGYLRVVPFLFVTDQSTNTIWKKKRKGEKMENPF